VPTQVTRDEVQRLVAAGAQLVEVLPLDEFEEEHLPNAIHLPLKGLTRRAAEDALDRDRPVIVYCWDALCDMSPRAAWRLEALGYKLVYDYVTGKADWMAAGLSTVAKARPARVADVIDRSPPTCTPAELVQDVVTRLGHGGSDICVVVNEHGVVLGRLRLDRLERADTRTAEDAMEPGPTTVRADAQLAETTERMRSRHATSLIVSNPDGVLLGLLRLDSGRP
jgi:rhodanese-related sulfurtransferase